MREILFRGKSDAGNLWEYGYLVLQYDEYGNKGAFIVKETGAKSFVTPETVGQYTGLTDKNGIKIFEGDIVKQTFETTIKIDDYDSLDIFGYDAGEAIIIPSKGACIKNPYQYREENGEIIKNYEKTKMCKNIALYRCEIIGNIYDNPELLEVKK